MFYNFPLTHLEGILVECKFLNIKLVLNVGTRLKKIGKNI